MRVLITGGHFAPAQAVIEELKKRHHQVAVAGRRHPFEGDRAESYEYRVVRSENIEFFEIKAGRFQRKFTAYTITSLLKTPSGFLRALSIIKEFKPDVVVTFGGYIGFPISYAAKTLGIPVVLHEQTQRVGLAASWIAKIAAKVCLAFESSSAHFPSKKVVLTGNPIRRGVFEIEKKFEYPSGKKVIYVTGGSAGSHFINSQIEQNLPDLLAEFVVIHQTGDNKFEDYERLLKLKESLPENLSKNYFLKKFVGEEEIGYILKSADLVIARSGVNTVCELIATGSISLLIPLTSGQIGEQLSNAKLVKKLRVGDYINEEEVSAVTLRQKISEMLKNLGEYRKNTAEAKKIIVPQASEKIVDVIEEVYDVKARN